MAVPKKPSELMCRLVVSDEPMLAVVTETEQLR